MSAPVSLETVTVAQAATPKKKKGGKKAAEPVIPPALLDLFTRQTEEEQQFNLLAEHRAQLESQRSLSEGRIAALRVQLQTQLFTIWNEVWMQRQKSHDDAFKSWVKLLTS